MDIIEGLFATQIVVLEQVECQTTIFQCFFIVLYKYIKNFYLQDSLVRIVHNCVHEYIEIYYEKYNILFPF